VHEQVSTPRVRGDEAEPALRVRYQVRQSDRGPQADGVERV